ncbi:MAG: acyltransferase [Polyangiaceae bacterium]
MSGPVGDPPSGPAKGSVKSASHLRALDGLRGVAVLMVLFHNLNALSDTASLARRLYDIAANWGWLGVQLFFVLSGFLITGILLDTRESEGYYRVFILRRALRIFPLYYAVLLVAFVGVPLVLGRRIPGSEHQLWLWIYLENWVAPAEWTVVGFTHFWSLCIEEQFYLVWPWVVLLASGRRLSQICVGLAVVALASRVALIVGSDVGPEGPYAFTICRIDALVFGALGAIAYRDEALVDRFLAARRRFRWGILALTVATLLATKAAPRVGVLTQTYGFTLFGIVAAVLVFDAAVERDPKDGLLRALSWAPLRQVGKYSYAMYVFHLPLHLAFGRRWLRSLVGEDVGVGLATVYLVVGSLVTFLLAALSYWLFERHFLHLKRRFVVRTAPAATG